MSPPRPERLQRRLAFAALLALAPKCVLCLLAFAGLGAAVGPGGPEICGPTDDSAAVRLEWLWPVAVGTIVAARHVVRRRQSRLSASP